MSEFKTDALPKRGHVNEVCKEWLVREDGALAYKLQSQEINDFYKGNRYRNEVVRTDFPTALNEQIKEKENAQKQTECYKKYLSEQEEHDKRVALKIAEKLEKDLLEQRQRELEESEAMADRLQSIYVNLPLPGASLAAAQLDPYSENASISNNIRPPLQIHPQEVGLPTLDMHSLNSNTEQFHQSIDHRQPKKIHNLLHDPLDSTHVSNVSARNININRPKLHTPQQQPLIVDKYHQYPEAEEIFTPLTSDTAKSPSHNHSYKNNANRRSPSSDGQVRADLNFQKLSRDNFEHLADNNSQHRLQHMQEHADDIELYVDPSLQEIGLPMDEIKEMNKKIKQEKKDAELARKLQQMEQQSGMTLEARDRLLAIEAQDKELAKMLQEREKAKAKRAKEKARLRKHQYQKESNSIHSGPLQPLPQDSLLSTPPSRKSEEIDPIDLEAYSNPKDLISHQRIQSENFRGNSVHSTLEHADNSKEDDIYTLPVDSCGPNRPASLGPTPDNLHNNSLTRSENFSLLDNQNETHDSLRKNHSMSSSYDQSSSPAPPYMPIQGTRRCNSNEERKKRSKDLCTHQ